MANPGVLFPFPERGKSAILGTSSSVVLDAAFVAFSKPFFKAFFQSSASLAFAGFRGPFFVVVFWLIIFCSLARTSLRAFFIADLACENMSESESSSLSGAPPLAASVSAAEVSVKWLRSSFRWLRPSGPSGGPISGM